ncbi:MAG: transglycosylase domain-containing protein [Fusobacteriota bacterium]
MKKKILKVILGLFLFFFFLGGTVSVVLITKAYKSLPNIAKTVESYNPIIPTIIYDINGKVVDKISRENREIVSIDKIPQHTRDAFVAIEDRKFYNHHGFDPLRLFRATFIRFITFRRMQGASTITQQLAKNAFLTQQRKIMRKVKEAILTLEIEKKYTKNEILEKYVNEIYFGSGAYGIQAASEYYFGKDVSELTLAESALLAGVPNRPNAYNPSRHLDNALERQKIVLSQMKKYGFITSTEYQKAINYEIVINTPKHKNYDSPSFTSIITEKIFNNYTEKQIYEEGLRIYTTVDLEMQKVAEDSFNNGYYLREREDLNGALVTIDSNTGYVKAIVGGKNYKAGNFNRATMAIRQPGSSFKPFLYLTALRLGYQMNLLVEDSELKFGDWEPQNYSELFRGNMTLLQGMEDSVNIVAIKLLKKLIIKNMIKTARLAGITTDIPYDLSTALGSIGITPLELASGYVPFSNGGFKIEPIFIKKIEDRYGKIIFENNIKKEKVFDSESISMLVHMMKNVVKNGSGKNANVNIPQAGKTGTTNNFSNAWFSGYTPDFVTTIYAGYDDNKSMGNGMTGGQVAASIWGDYVQTLIDKDLYIPTEFNFLEDNVKNKKLIYEDIDLKTGLLTNSGPIRKGLFNRSKLPVEYNTKYNNGLEPLLIKEEISNDDQKSNKQNEKPKSNIEKIEEKDKKDVIGDILDNILF